MTGIWNYRQPWYVQCRIFIMMALGNLVFVLNALWHACAVAPVLTLHQIWLDAQEPPPLTPQQRHRMREPGWVLRDYCERTGRQRVLH